MTASYKICNKCIMDTSDPTIIFSLNGTCEYCSNYEDVILPDWNYGKNSFDDLMSIGQKIKLEGKGKDFDCIVGLSGGLDSSYTAYVAKEIMGLRPLLFHVDAGWNTDQAVGNIEKLVDGLGLDLYTEVINWEEMKDLQLSFLKSQVADQDIPQDTAFFSALYKFARKNKIKYVLTGGNYSTEVCREPTEWGAYPGIDSTLIKGIHKKFGTTNLTTFPIVDVFKYKVFYRYVLGMKVFKPLNFIPYFKKDAEDTLFNLYGWNKFKHKHHESRFTRFYEDYWMPKKFGYEKRRAHFSSLIMTKQMTREEALERISSPELSDDFWKQEFVYIANKLNVTVEELELIFNEKNKSYKDYKNKKYLIDIASTVALKLGVEKRLYK